MSPVAGQFQVFLLATGVVGVALDAHPTLGVQLQELHDLEHRAVGRVLQLRFAGVEQYVAQGHHQATVGLGGEAGDLRFNPLALLLHAGQLVFAQGQLQALTFQLQLGAALGIQALLGVLSGDGAVPLAQVGVMHHIGAAAPVAGQAIGAGQGLSGADHVLGREAQHVGVFLDLLKVIAGLLQRLLTRGLARTAAQGHAAQQQYTAQATDHRAHCASPNCSCLRRRVIRVLSTFNCSWLLPVSTLASARRASSSACSARIRARL